MLAVQCSLRSDKTPWGNYTIRDGYNSYAADVISILVIFAHSDLSINLTNGPKLRRFIDYYNIG